MIKLNATARIHSISPVIQVSGNFQKRELVLDDSWERDGKVYQNFILIEFSGDKMSQLDSFRAGQVVTVEAIINGREHNGRYFNSIRGQLVTAYQRQQQAAPAPLPSNFPFS